MRETMTEDEKINGKIQMFKDLWYLRKDLPEDGIYSVLDDKLQSIGASLQKLGINVDELRT